MGKHGMAEGNHNSPPPGRRGRGGGPNFLATSSIATTPPLRGTPPPSEEGSRCAVIHEGFGLFKVDSWFQTVGCAVIHGTVFAVHYDYRGDVIRPPKKNNKKGIER
jgi:hypothetical protein